MIDTAEGEARARLALDVFAQSMELLIEGVRRAVLPFGDLLASFEALEGKTRRREETQRWMDTRC